MVLAKGRFSNGAAFLFVVGLLVSGNRATVSAIKSVSVLFFPTNALHYLRS